MRMMSLWVEQDERAGLASSAVLLTSLSNLNTTHIVYLLIYALRFHQRLCTTDTYIPKEPWELILEGLLCIRYAPRTASSPEPPQKRPRNLIKTSL
jgi:hypothetical protein